MTKVEQENKFCSLLDFIKMLGKYFHGFASSVLKVLPLFKHLFGKLSWFIENL